MVVGGWGGLDFDRLSLSLSVSVSPFDRPHGCENLAGECHQEQKVQGSILVFWKSARVGRHQEQNVLFLFVVVFFFFFGCLLLLVGGRVTPGAKRAMDKSKYTG